MVKAMDKALRTELMRLSKAEKLEVIDELRESLEPADFPLTADQMAEVDRRLAEHARNPGRAQPWSEVRAEIRALFK